MENIFHWLTQIVGLWVFAVMVYFKNPLNSPINPNSFNCSYHPLHATCREIRRGYEDDLKRYPNSKRVFINYVNKGNEAMSMYKGWSYVSYGDAEGTMWGDCLYQTIEAVIVCIGIEVVLKILVIWGKRIGL